MILKSLIVLKKKENNLTIIVLEIYYKSINHAHSQNEYLYKGEL
jgi:hypothetical protein